MRKKKKMRKEKETETDFRGIKVTKHDVEKIATDLGMDKTPN